MSLASTENRIIWWLDFLRDHAALAVGTLVLATVALAGLVSFGAGPKSDGAPRDALQIQVMGLTGTKVIFARRTSEISSRMGVMSIRYLGYYDNVWHQAGGVGFWVDVPGVDPPRGEEDDRLVSGESQEAE